MLPRPPSVRAELRHLAAAALLVLLACSGAATQGRSAPTSRPTSSPGPSLSPAPASPAASPQRLEASLPQPIQETAAAELDGRLYVIGGLDAALRSSDAVFVHDGGWRAGPRLPLGLDHPAAAVLGGRLYVAGGFASGPASRRVLRLDGDHWTELAPLRHARGALALASAGGRLWVLGGSDGGEVAAVEAFDPVPGTWSDVAVLPAPRNHLSGFSQNGLACAAGGRPPTSVRVDCLEPASAGWRRLPDLPLATSGAGAGSLGGVILVAGGEDAEESRVVARVNRLQDGGWSSEPMLEPRHGIALAEHQGRLWACGGADLAGLHPVAVCTSLG